MIPRRLVTRIPRFVAGVFVASALTMTSAVAGEGSLSVIPLDDASRELQFKANELYESGNAERAFFIYKNDLAPKGDKYAQYMVGYMYQKGAGVEEDALAASAWFRLAASGRGRSEFAEVADASVRALSTAERALANEAYLELSRRYSDVVVVLRQVRDDITFLNQSPTLLPEGSQSITAEVQRPAVSSAHRKTAEKRVSSCLEYLSRELGKPQYEAAWTEIDIDALSADVDTWLEQSE